MTVNKKVGVLGEPVLRIYLGFQLISLTGTMLQSGILSMLIRDIVGDKAKASFWIGVIWAIGYLPGIIIAPLSGVFYDRLNIKKVLQVTGIIGALQAFTLAYLCYTGRQSIPWLLVLVCVMGIVNPVDAVGRNAMVKLIALREENVRPANQMFASLYNIAQVVGPGCGAYLIMHIGYSGTFTLNALSFVVLVIALIKVHYAERAVNEISAMREKSAHEKPKNISQRICEGAQYTFSHPGIRICIIMSAIVTIFWFGVYAIFNIIAEEFYAGTMETTKRMASTLSGASGVGAFLGALLSMPLCKKVSIKYVTAWSVMLMGISMFLFAYTTSIATSSVAIFFTGLGFMSAFVALRGTIPHLSRNDLIATVMGYTMMWFFGGIAFGTFAVGYFAKHYSCHDVIVTISILTLITGLIIPFLSGMNKLR